MRWALLGWSQWEATEKQRCNSEFTKWNDMYTTEWHGIVSHYDDVRMGAMASQITSLTIVYSTVYSGADQSKHQSSASLAFVWGLHRGPVNSRHKWPVTREMFPFDYVIMNRSPFRRFSASFLGDVRGESNPRVVLIMHFFRVTMYFPYWRCTKWINCYWDYH